jgi:biotin--protein ligase
MHHRDEQVTLMTTNPPTKVRIFGISPDTGFLRTIPEQGPDLKPIDLQPDGNSFDMMAGLIKTKS